ncbi:MAG TPA: Na+/H+ antiporter subunit E [Solirubrobacteraceae bacterium]|nr:Na+/H+ antiporter subunit E [Solirubrobacteraceae bacterium]
MSVRGGISFLARWAAFFAIYLLLADTPQTAELYTGIVAALLAATLATGLDRHRSVDGSLRVSMLRFAYRPFLALVTDTVRATWALARVVLLRRPVSGRFRTARYTATSDEAEDVGRRILTEWAGSVGANRYVIGIDPEREHLIVHELVAADSPLDPLELG